jgi:predicted adenylyl cyclase CyaB
MKREIEIRIAFDKKSFLNLRKRIRKIAKFKRKSREIDDYFTPFHRNFVKPKYPFEWLRIGKRGNRNLITYKHYYPENAEYHTHCDEYETGIENSKALKKIFSVLDFKKLIRVDKKREVYFYKNKFEITLDVVKNLGYFAEIEAKKDFGGVRKTRRKIFEFLKKKLGFKNFGEDKEINKGYPYLLMKKKGLTK